MSRILNPSEENVIRYLLQFEGEWVPPAIIASDLRDGYISVFKVDRICQQLKMLGVLEENARHWFRITAMTS